MAIQIDVWPMRGLRLMGTLTIGDVDRLIEAILEHPERGATSIHFEDLARVYPDAAVELRRRLSEQWDSGGAKYIMYLHVVAGDVADTLAEAGFEERDGNQQLIYMTPRS